MTIREALQDLHKLAGELGADTPLAVKNGNFYGVTLEVQEKRVSATLTIKRQTMKKGSFKKKTVKIGSNIYGIALACTEFLKKIEAQPLVLVKGKTNSPGNWLGPLILKGLAKLSDDRTQYEITSKGKKYLEDVDAVMK